jgi:S1-C subfamily serine protease
MSIMSILAGLLAASSAFAAGPFGTIHVGAWIGGAYTNDSTGAFSHCAAVTSYNSGINLAVGQTVAGPWLMAFEHPAWKLSPGATYPIDVTFDGQAQFHLFGTAATENSVHVALPTNAVIDQLRKSQLMAATAYGQTIQFYLNSTGQLLPTIANCVTKTKSAGVGSAGDFSVPAPKAAAASASAKSTVVASAAVPQPAKPPKLVDVNGTGFVINTNGYIVTNNHVISNCVGDIHGNLTSDRITNLRIVSADETNDLALLQAPQTFQTTAAIRGTAIHPGESVIAIGYPFHGLLTSDFTVTTGIVSSLSGVLNDTRYLQISAPIQPGNSGGPLLDASGNIVGVVAAKINALRFAKATGDIPENINFAIKTGAMRDFLDNSAISYQTAEPSGDLKAAQIASNARAYTMLISCSAKETEGEKK